MTSVAIVGSGPVGLFLAKLLARRGARVTILERKASGRRGSRAIGLHPPGLEAVSEIGVASGLISSGVAIRRARIYLNRDYVGSLSLDAARPYPFVLSLPQASTECALEAALSNERAVQLRRAVSVVSVTRSKRGGDERGMLIELANGDAFEADFVVGCDGRRSVVRSSLEIGAREYARDDHYLMADLPDDSDLEHDAAFFLSDAGVVESFPLPEGFRRWVVRVTTRPGTPDTAALTEIVEFRTGIRVRAQSDSPASAFTPHSLLAHSLSGTGWALAGDAAHVVSPIGGQGLNLGLLGAAELVGWLERGSPPGEYDLIQRRRAVRVARRARLNMLLGSERTSPRLRRIAAMMILASPWRAAVARYFTMSGLTRSRAWELL